MRFNCSTEVGSLILSQIIVRADNVKNISRSVKLILQHVESLGSPVTDDHEIYENSPSGLQNGLIIALFFSPVSEIWESHSHGILTEL